MANTELRAFFDRLTDEASLQALVRDREQENVHLEFKKKKSASTPELDKSDSWQFSRALSGFANSDGVSPVRRGCTTSYSEAEQTGGTAR